MAAASRVAMARLRAAPGRRLPAAGGGRSCRRHIRTGFFPEDPEYIDPEIPLLADPINMRWRYMDDAPLTAPVLERSNVGMGMLVLNRPKGLDLATINELYVRLRNLEVNSLKRFVGLASAEPGPFCLGLDPTELLLAATSAMRRGRLPRFSRALLWHSQELAHLLADFRKPVVCHVSGEASNNGAALACLASHGGAHMDAELRVDACFAGLVPDGGMTYALARLRWHLGEFLALTGWPVRGPDLVYAGLIRRWQSPEALPFLELTAEKQLEVSEADARALLDEHALPLPEGMGENDAIPREIVPLVDKAFSGRSVNEIAVTLEKMREHHDPLTRDFAKECLDRMSRASPLALHATLWLIRQAKTLAQQEASREQRILGAVHGGSVMGAHGERGPLVTALQLELRVQQRLLISQDAARGLHALCLGREMRQGEWSRRNIKEVVEEEIIDLVQAPRASVGESADFAVLPRSEFSLSTHPRLRRYHPDYNEETGLDHDPLWMKDEMTRWSPDLFAGERDAAVRELLGSEDPARCGLSRWVRVESPAQ